MWFFDNDGILKNRNIYKDIYDLSFLKYIKKKWMFEEGIQHPVLYKDIIDYKVKHYIKLKWLKLDAEPFLLNTLEDTSILKRINIEVYIEEFNEYFKIPFYGSRKTEKTLVLYIDGEYYYSPLELGDGLFSLILDGKVYKLEYSLVE